MPNWCSNRYRIVGSEEDIRSFCNLIDYLVGLDKPLVQNGFGNTWLGCIVEALGGDWNQIECRGEFSDYSKDSECQMTLYSQTAWSEKPSFRHFLEEKYKSFKIYYTSEEPGMGSFFTNDPFAEEYNVDYYVDGDGDIEELSENGIIELINDVIVKDGAKVTTIEEAKAAVEKFNDNCSEDDYFYIHAYEFCDD